MKKVIIGSLFMLLSIVGCSPKHGFSSLSEKLYKKNGGRNDKSTFKLNAHRRDARDKLFSNDSVAFLKGDIDTLYLLEGYNIETGTLHSTIWHKNDIVSYDYFGKTLGLKPKSIFTDYQISLVTNWDISSIKKEEGTHGNWLDNNLQITAYRCHRLGKFWQIDELHFKDFYDPKRDN